MEREKSDFTRSIKHWDTTIVTDDMSPLFTPLLTPSNLNNIDTTKWVFPSPEELEEFRKKSEKEAAELSKKSGFTSPIGHWDTSKWDKLQQSSSVNLEAGKPPIDKMLSIREEATPSKNNTLKKT